MNPIETTSVPAAIVISILALAFTVASFWWMNVRSGHLTSFEPQTYSGYMKEQSFRLRLPLTIYNTGAKTLVVTDLRVVFLKEAVVVPVITFRSSLKPVSADVVDFAHPFSVPGRQAVTRFVEFGRQDWSPEYEMQYAIAVEARTGKAKEWVELVCVELTAPEPTTGVRYIAHRRDPADEAPPPDVWFS